MDEPLKYYTKWNKPDTKVHIFYDFVYIKYLYYKNPFRQKIDQWLPGLEIWGSKEWVLIGMPFLEWWNILELTLNK